MGGVGSIEIGSDENGAPFCREFAQTHITFVPSRTPCLSESDPLYDSRLLRPTMVRSAVRFALRFLPKAPADPIAQRPAKPPRAPAPMP